MQNEMKRYLFILIMIVGLLAGKAWSVVPIITGWSSTGGITQNKDNAQDIMYLVTQGDNLTFTVTVDQTLDYEWQVNKSTENSVNSDTFNWTVPNEDDIWEIHLKCWNGSDEEVHMEWVVSTLSTEEAPDFFDYFADLKHNGRIQKDPWDRTVNDWNEYGDPMDTSRGFIRPFGTEDIRPQPYVESTHIPKYGTWKFRYRFPDGNTGHFGFSCYYNASSEVNYNCYYGKCSDSHHHCSVPRGLNGSQFSIDYDSGGWCEDGNWHEVTIIRTPETWLYMYNDNLFEFYAQDSLTELTPTMIRLDMSRYSGHEPQIDNFEVYREKYLFPDNEIKYENYIFNYYCQSYYYYPEYRQGIVVKGKNIRLVDIANAINDPSKFSYSGNTAICYVDLVIYDGTEFIINNETLKFHCDFEGECHFAAKYGAEIKIENSTITTTNDNYFIWNNAGSTTHFGHSLTDEREYPGENKRYNIMPLEQAGHIRFILNDSTINNTTHIFFDSPMELSITNTCFTNLRELDIGNYSVSGSHLASDKKEREFAQGDKSFWVFTDDMNINNFNFRDVIFNGKDSPINVTFLINAIRDKLNIYNVDLASENVVVKKVLPQTHGQSHTLKWYKQHDVDHDGDGIDSKIGLVNCKFNSLIIETDKAWGIPKYYLDVKVIDGNGDSVDGANVTVFNEVDNINYPAENMEENIDWWDPDVPDYEPEWGWQKFYLHRHITQGITHKTTVTGVDGHTSLPLNKEHILVMADYVKDQMSQTNFTYTITASKDGKTASLNGLDIDESWYREDPNVPTKTVVMVLGGQSYVSDDTVEPVLSITIPQNGAKVFGRVPIKINAADNFGVIKVELYINDILVQTFYNPPYEWIWDTGEISAGEYTIKAVAYDTNNNTNEKEITVKVIKVEGIVTYPNPYIGGKGYPERISFANLPKEATIRIYTISGKLIKRIKHKDAADGGSREWDVSEISSGIYLYTIISPEGKKTGKVSVVK